MNALEVTGLLVAIFGLPALIALLRLRIRDAIVGAVVRRLFRLREL